MYLLVVGVVVGTTGVSNAGLDVLILVEALERFFNTPMDSSCERMQWVSVRRKKELGRNETSAQTDRQSMKMEWRLGDKDEKVFNKI